MSQPHPDRDEYEACMHEADAWQQTVDSLRAALRVVTVCKYPDCS